MNDPLFHKRLAEYVKLYPNNPPSVAIQSVIIPDPTIYRYPRGLKTTHKGNYIRTINTRILKTNANVSFHDFLFKYLLHEMGDNWLKSNNAKPLEQKHVVARWADDHKDFRAKLIQSENKEGNFYKAMPPGSLKALLCLADDIYRLQLIDAFPKKLKKRLQNMETFQSARHEILAAASFARTGFKIKWLDQKSSGRIPEFIATNSLAGETVVVEAKSRHRQGVLGVPGEPPTLEEIKADFFLLYKDAITQYEGSDAYVIFIDLNVPLQPEKEGFDKLIWDGIKKVMDKFPEDSEETPAPFSALFFTNYAWHYDGRNIAAPGELVSSLPFYTSRPFANNQTFAAIQNAVRSLGNVDPNE